MLRRKLFLVLGSVVALLLAGALGAILLLQGLLTDLNHVSLEAAENAAAASRFSSTLTAIETEISRRIQGDVRDTPLNLSEAVAVLEDQCGYLPEPFDRVGPQLDSCHRRLTANLSDLTALVASQAAAFVEQAGGDQLDAILNVTVVLRQELAEFTRLSSTHTQLDHERQVVKFRTVVIGLGLLFVALLNISIVVLLQAATMVLRPVNALMDASRHLAQDEFDHRISLDRTDEFGELAGVFNHMAEQLQANEERKIETLHQVARTLNHELNNAIAIIDLQLCTLERSPENEHRLAPSLRQIHKMLERITGTVNALKKVRRIVLTDYISGVKMLDLERSVEDNPLIETQIDFSGSENPQHESPDDPDPTISPLR